MHKSSMKSQLKVNARETEEKRVLVVIVRGMDGGGGLVMASQELSDVKRIFILMCIFWIFPRYMYGIGLF